MSKNKESFDIDTLLNFRPPSYHCEKCYGLLSSQDFSYTIKEKATCPICKVEYIVTDRFKYSRDVGSYLESQYLGIKFDNLIAHSKTLAWIGYKLRTASKNKFLKFQPMRALLESLGRAEKFVHFASYGLSHLLLGSLKSTALRVPVRGIVSKPEDYVVDEIKRCPDETPALKIQVYGNVESVQKEKPIPHQKIIIIDGLIAFKGSANLTVSGWRKAAEGREIIDFVTDVQEVIDLNNKYFSPIWAEFSDFDQQIEMWEEVPF